MWKVIKVNDNEFPIIKLDNGRAVMVEIYYGEEASSDGMTRDEYMAVVNAFAMAKEALDMSLHDNCSYWPNGGRCQCPWCKEAYPILDALANS